MEPELKNSSNAVDLTLVLNDFEEKWVVLSLDNTEVLASGESFDDIAEKIKLGIVMRVPRFDCPISPSGYR